MYQMFDTYFKSRIFMSNCFVITLVKHYIPPHSSCRNILFEVNVRKNYYSLFLPKHGQNIISKFFALYILSLLTFQELLF